MTFFKFPAYSQRLCNIATQQTCNLPQWQWQICRMRFLCWSFGIFLSGCT